VNTVSTNVKGKAPDWPWVIATPLPERLSTTPHATAGTDRTQHCRETRLRYLLPFRMPNPAVSSVIACFRQCPTLFTTSITTSIGPDSTHRKLSTYKLSLFRCSRSRRPTSGIRLCINWLTSGLSKPAVCSRCIRDRRSNICE